MRLYELVLIVKGSLSESERKKALSSVKEWLKDVKITKEEDWGQKPLAYKIKRELAGVFHVFHFETEGITADLERKLFQNENIIRHLLVRRK